VAIKLTRIVGAIALAGTTTLANATITVLDFEGIGDLAAINDFYNGGTDSDGNSGTNYGIQFSPNTLGIIDEDAGGTGNFANEPSPDTVMFWLDDTDAIMNVPAGFDTGFSFFYSSSTAASVSVYDELDATGTLLGTIDLVAQGFDDCTGDPTGDFCNWTPIGVAFAGTAKSIDFGGTANRTGYDDVTFGSDIPDPSPNPEPATLALLGLGIAGLAHQRRRRRNG
jgi:hypothetical protein